MLTKYGYKADPPKKADQKPDFDFTAGLLPKLPQVSQGDVDLMAFCTESHQYSIGSCTGNASADSVEVLNAIEGKPGVQLSRLFVYTLARNFMDQDGDGKGDIDKDDGAFLRFCFEVLSKFGICREDLPAGKGGWPYDVNKVHTLPDLMAMRAATAHRIHSYYRISETGDNRLEKIVAALRANHPVTFGTIVDTSFQQIRDETPWEGPKGQILGGHAMLVVGYLASFGFIVKNSWGKNNFGFNGFCIVKPHVLASKETGDLWVPTKGTAFKLAA